MPVVFDELFKGKLNLATCEGCPIDQAGSYTKGSFERDILDAFALAFAVDCLGELYESGEDAAVVCQPLRRGAEVELCSIEAAEKAPKDQRTAFVGRWGHRFCMLVAISAPLP